MASVDAVICSIWSRGECQEADRSKYFERARCNGRIQIQTLGLEGNLTFHTLPRGQCLHDRGERAILAQTRQTYSELCEAFPHAQKTLGDGSSPAFGETFILDGFSCRDACIGDIFEVSLSTLRLQVSSPRFACMRVDRKHPSNSDIRTGQQGTVRHFVNGTGRGGIFFRVLTPGEAGDGDRLTLVRRPYPKWTLEYLSSLTFPIQASSCLTPTWNGSAHELQELCEIEELALHEWKEVYCDLREKEVVSVNVDALSGNGTLEKVGIRMTGIHQCQNCNQRFDTEKAKLLHWKFVHDPERSQEPEDNIFH